MLQAVPAHPVGSQCHALDTRATERISITWAGDARSVKAV